jgi:Transmembrane adaptor Erv26
LFGMGVIFRVFTNIAGYGSFLLCAFALTACLYLLAEFAEEHPTWTGRLLKSFIIGVVSMYVILWMDGLPWKETLVGISCHLTYYTMLNKFPFIEILSIRSMCSLVAVVVSHYWWFAYFMDVEHSFSIHQIIGFFIVMVWAVPCGLMISLTLNENTLPNSNPSGFPADGVKKHATVYISVVNFCTGTFKYVTEMALPAKGKSFIGGSRYGGKKSY